MTRALAPDSRFLQGLKPELGRPSFVTTKGHALIQTELIHEMACRSQKPRPNDFRRDLRVLRGETSQHLHLNPQGAHGFADQENRAGHHDQSFRLANFAGSIQGRRNCLLREQ